MTRMTSRQRVLAALNHQEPDRLPIDIGGLISFTCWHEDAERDVKASLGYAGGEPVINSAFARTAQPDPRIRDRFHVDCFGLGSKPASTWRLDVHTEPDGGSWFIDEWGIKWRRPADGYYFDAVSRPLEGATLAEIARFPWPDPTDPARLAEAKETAKHYYENSEYCLVFSPVWSTGVFQTAAVMQGYEEFYVNLLAEKKISMALMEAVTEFHVAQCNAILDALGDYIQVIVMSDDLGFQDRPIVRLNLFREIVKPHYKRIVDTIKSRKPEMKLVFHCDGAIYQFLAEFIDVGIDATNPVQVSCLGMDDTAKLKRDFGDRLCFWGAGVDTQSTLPFGTPEQVRAEVKRRIGDLAPGGGYVFATVHNVQRDVPVDNIIACYDAAHEFGQYPIRL